VPHSAEFGVDVIEDQLGLVSHFRSSTCPQLQSYGGGRLALSLQAGSTSGSITMQCELQYLGS
jgi:hypothetical protein